MMRVRFGEPLPKSWRYAAIVVAVLLLTGLGELGKSLTIGGILVAIAVGLGVGIVTRTVYRRPRR